MSNGMNEIMKVLTIISRLFIPLTFIVGIYGLNFDPQVSQLNLPELNWYYGYPACLLVMAVIAGAQLFFFRHKGWIGGKKERIEKGRKLDNESPKKKIRKTKE